MSVQEDGMIYALSGKNFYIMRLIFKLISKLCIYDIESRRQFIENIVSLESEVVLHTGEPHSRPKYRNMITFVAI